MPRFTDVPGHDQQQRRHHGHRHESQVAGQQQDPRQNGHRVNGCRNRRSAAGAHIGRGAGDRRCSDKATEKRRDYIGEPLPDQFAVGVVSGPRHPVQHRRAQQGFDSAQGGNGHGRAQKRLNGRP